MHNFLSLIYLHVFDVISSNLAGLTLIRMFAQITKYFVKHCKKTKTKTKKVKHCAAP